MPDQFFIVVTIDKLDHSGCQSGDRLGTREAVFRTGIVDGRIWDDDCGLAAGDDKYFASIGEAERRPNGSRFGGSLFPSVHEKTIRPAFGTLYQTGNAALGPTADDLALVVSVPQREG